MAQPPDDVETLLAENERLRAENDELTLRFAELDLELATLRDEALERRAEVRRLAEALPTAMSRKALLLQMAHDVRHHPDKRRMLGRAVAKLGRGFKKAGRTVRAWFR
jgi:cell division septum initiation protein DivIVA